MNSIFLGMATDNDRENPKIWLTADVNALGGYIHWLIESIQLLPIKLLRDEILVEQDTILFTLTSSPEITSKGRLLFSKGKLPET